jgi:hypothetical protein
MIPYYDKNNNEVMNGYYDSLIMINYEYLLRYTLYNNVMNGQCRHTHHDKNYE